MGDYEEYERTYVDITIGETDEIGTEKLLRALNNLIQIAVMKSVGDDASDYDRAVSRNLAMAFTRIRRQANTISDLATSMLEAQLFRMLAMFVLSWPEVLFRELIGYYRLWKFLRSFPPPTDE